MLSKIKKTASSIAQIRGSDSRTVFTGYDASKSEKFTTRGIALRIFAAIAKHQWQTVQQELEGCDRPLEWLARVEDADGGLLLHRTIENGAPVAIAEKIFAAFPGATKVADFDGWLPLHYCARFSTEGVLVQHVFQAYTDGSTVQTADGSTPLHYAAGCATQGTIDILDIFLQLDATAAAFPDRAMNILCIEQ